MEDIEQYAPRSGRVIKENGDVVNEADGIQSDGSRLMKLSGSNAQEPFSGNADVVHTFSKEMNGFVISNDGSSDLTFSFGKNDTNILPTDSSGWVQGTLSSTTGGMQNATTRIRTVNYFDLWPDTDYKLAWNTVDYQVSIHQWTEDDTWLEGTSWLRADYSFKTLPDAGKGKIIVNRLDGADIFPSEIDQIAISLKRVDGFLVKAGEVFEAKFAPFTQVTINTTSQFRAYGLGG